MNEVEMTASIDNELLNQFEEICDNEGTTVEDVLRSFAQGIVQDKSILVQLIEEHSRKGESGYDTCPD